MRVYPWLMLALFATSTNVTAQSDIQVQKISASVHLLQSKQYGTNIGVIKNEQSLVLIDPMPGKQQIKHLQQMIKLLYPTGQILLLNTHDHQDHTGGNDYFIQQGALLFSGKFEQLGLQHIQLNSHSSKDSIYYHPLSNSVFVGDIIEVNWHPTFYAGGIQGFEQAIDSILALGDPHTKIIPGHGPVIDKQQLLLLKQATLNWVARLTQLLAKGKSQQDILADAKSMQILQQFNLDNQVDFLPQKAIKRFIQRTVTVINKE